MKRLFIPIMALTLMASVPVLADELGEERDAKQAELDAACEAARLEKIIAERIRLTEECVETELLRDRETCERFYSDYGESAANQAPLFYDLPECEKAHEYRNSYRRSGR